MDDLLSAHERDLRRRIDDLVGLALATYEPGAYVRCRLSSRQRGLTSRGVVVGADVHRGRLYIRVRLDHATARRAVRDVHHGDVEVGGGDP